MRISDSNLNAVTTSAQQAAQAAAAGAAGRAGVAKAGTRSDQVQISDLSSALRALSAGSPEREARVDQLAAVYQAGHYRVDAAAVSRSVVSEALAGR
jgi:flagellar biosynthesis anti-sigma factor FlgM